jgi:tetratricopeptide (TPR) repeat protein
VGLVRHDQHKEGDPMQISYRKAVVAGPVLAAAMTLASLTAGAAGGSTDRSATSSPTPSVVQDDYARAKGLIDREQYRDAIPILERLVTQNPADTDALNELGYSHRELGHSQRALGYYLKALAIEPEHVGANEYLGELYLEMKDLPKAEERLAVLQKACGNCEEFSELKEKIADYKAKQQS